LSLGTGDGGFHGGSEFAIRIPSATSGRADPAVMSANEKGFERSFDSRVPNRSYVVAQGCVEDV